MNSHTMERIVLQNTFDDHEYETPVAIQRSFTAFNPGAEKFSPVPTEEAYPRALDETASRAASQVSRDAPTLASSESVNVSREESCEEEDSDDEETSGTESDDDDEGKVFIVSGDGAGTGGKGERLADRGGRATKTRMVLSNDDVVQHVNAIMPLSDRIPRFVKAHDRDSHFAIIATPRATANTSTISKTPKKVEVPRLPPKGTVVPNPPVPSRKFSLLGRGAENKNRRSHYLVAQEDFEYCSATQPLKCGPYFPSSSTPRSGNPALARDFTSPARTFHSTSSSGKSLFAHTFGLFMRINS